MESNIRTEVSIGNPGICPIARASKDANTVINDISRSSVETPDGTVVEEFTLGQDASTPKQAEITKVFAYDSHSIYRFSRERGRPCVCETIERFGCPVSEIYARDGELYVSFYAPDIETVQDIVTGLQDGFGKIQVRQLTRSDDRSEQDLVFVDRSRLTDRQREVLETAHEMGYFSQPKRANKGDVAAALSLAPSTFSEHLQAAQRKVFDALLDS